MGLLSSIALGYLSPLNAKIFNNSRGTRDFLRSGVYETWEWLSLGFHFRENGGNVILLPV